MDFKEHEICNGQWREESRVSQGADCDGWLSAPCTTSFPGVTLLEAAVSFWKSAYQHSQFQEEKTLIQYILDNHKLSNGAKAENVNVGLAINK